MMSHNMSRLQFILQAAFILEKIINIARVLISVFVQKIEFIYF